MSKEFCYGFEGSLVHIIEPGVLLECVNDSSNQIFDLGKMNMYVFLNADFSKRKPESGDCYVKIHLLLGTEIYSCQIVKPSVMSEEEFLSSRFCKVC